MSSWFDEQIRQRIRTDDEMLSDAVARMVNLVSSEKIASVLADQGKLSEEAVGDILRYYHVKAQELPGDIKDMDDVLEYLLRPSGIMRRPVKLTRGWHKEAIGAMLGTKRMPRAITTFFSEGPKMPTNTRARRMLGNAKRQSLMRITTASKVPPM